MDGSYDDGVLFVIMVVPYHVICYSRCSTTTFDAYGRSRIIDPSQILSYHALPTKPCTVPCLVRGGGSMKLGRHWFSLTRQAVSDTSTHKGLVSLTRLS